MDDEEETGNDTEPTEEELEPSDMTISELEEEIGESSS